MDTYRVTNEDESYKVEADSKHKAMKLVLEKEGIFIKKEEFEDTESTKDRLIFLEQDDKEWDDVKIGTQGKTLGTDGCLVTCLSIFSYWCGRYFTPAEIAKKSKFTKEGYYYWKSGDDYLPFEFVWRTYKRDAKKIKSILYSKDNGCVVKCVGSYEHWLLVIGYDDKRGKFIGSDPLTGTSVYIEDVYGKIVGFAELGRK